MKWNFFREIARKGVHLTGIIVIIGYILIRMYVNENAALMTLIGLLLSLIFLEYLRLELDIRIPAIDYLIRPKEIGKMHSAIYFVAASIITFSVFQFNIALAANIMAIFGDMIAAVLGQKFGRAIIFKKKTYVGASSEFIVNLICGTIILLGHVNIYIIIIMAFGATVVETITENIDDNLLIPIATGFIGEILLLL